MSSLQCKQCGAPLVIEKGETEVACQYCHAKHSVRRKRKRKPDAKQTDNQIEVDIDLLAETIADKVHEKQEHREKKAKRVSEPPPDGLGEKPKGTVHTYANNAGITPSRSTVKKESVIVELLVAIIGNVLIFLIIGGVFWWCLHILNSELYRRAEQRKLLL